MPLQELSAPDSTASALQGQTAAALEPQNGLGWLPSTVPVIQTAEPLSVDKAEQPSPVKAELPVAAAVEQPAACNGAVDVLKEGPHVPQDPAPSQLAEVRPSATGKQLEMPVQGSKCFGHPARKTLTQSRWLARWGRCWLPRQSLCTICCSPAHQAGRSRLHAALWVPAAGGHALPPRPAELPVPCFPFAAKQAFPHGHLACRCRLMLQNN